MKDCKFTVHLIDARTKIPLKEFFDGDGNACVEAAPDLEWLFYLRNDGEEPAVGRMWVDGVSIGYDIGMEAKRVRNGIGLWNVRGNIQSDTALQFSLRANRGGATSKSRNSSSPHFGRVVVDFYEDLGSGVEKRHPDLDRDGGADFQKKQAKANQTDQIGGACAEKKAFETDVGGHTTAEEGILPNTPQQTTDGDVNTPVKNTERIDTSAAGATRLGLEGEKEDVVPVGIEIVSSSSEPARKKAKTGEK